MDTASDRVKHMIEFLNVDQVEFAKSAGASKSVVNQWLNGLIKSISSKYAYEIEKNTGFRKEWVMFGQEPDRIDRWKDHRLLCTVGVINQPRAGYSALEDDEKTIIEAFRLFGPEMRDAWLSAARDRLKKQAKTKVDRSKQAS